MDGAMPATGSKAEILCSSREPHPACESTSDHGHATDEQPQTAPTPFATQPAEKIAADTAAEAPWSVLPSREKAFVIIVGSLSDLPAFEQHLLADAEFPCSGYGRLSLSDQSHHHDLPGTVADVPAFVTESNETC